MENKLTRLAFKLVVPRERTSATGSLPPLSLIVAEEQTNTMAQHGSGVEGRADMAENPDPNPPTTFFDGKNLSTVSGLYHRPLM